MSSNIDDWNIEDVRSWLQSVGMDQYSDLICDKHKIDGPSLYLIDYKDLIKPPLAIPVLGDAKRLFSKICELRRLHAKKYYYHSINELTNCNETSDEELTTIVRSGTDIFSSSFEIKRCAVSLLYLFISCYITSISMVIVHNRVPDMEKFPPLPDFILDSLPVIPWAFNASEVLILTNFSIWVFILIFHQYRFILMKRYCNIFGSVFLLRSLTMLSTSLSVPGTHHQCISQMYIGLKATFIRSLEIMGYSGLSINGVKSCGDYMFSGHTVVHTLMTLFITEYTPKRYTLLHLMSRIFAAFGMFLILAAHEHYTLDVICAFYVSVRTFTNYHVMTTVKTVDREMAKSWNPVFYYMEKPIETAHVPNIYESPFTAIKRWAKVIKSKIN